MEGVHFDKDSGDLSYDLWEAQRDALNSFMGDESTDITDFRAGYRSGKSILGARAIIYGAWSVPSSSWAVVADSYKEGKKSTYDVLFKQFPGATDEDSIEDSPLVASYNKQDKILKLTNGSRIFLSTAQKWSELKGSSLNGAWLDEVAFYPSLYELIGMVLARMDAEPSRGIITTTTTNGYNDYFDIFERGVHPESEEDVSWNVETITADVRNNPFISDAAIERFERTHANNEAQGLKGGFSAAAGRVYDSFTRESHVVEAGEVEVQDGWRMYAYDSGWDDPRVVIEFGRTPRGQLVVLDEFYEEDCYVEDAIEWIRDRPEGVIYSEHEPEHMAKFRRKLSGYRVEAAYKSIDEGIEAVQERLMERDGCRGLLVCESASETVKEFLSYTVGDVGGSNVDDHCLDCVRYGIATPQEHELREKGASRSYTVRSSGPRTGSVDNSGEEGDSEEDESGGSVPESGFDRDKGRDIRGRKRDSLRSRKRDR